jgi:chromosome segregation ATPase
VTTRWLGALVLCLGAPLLSDAAESLTGLEQAVRAAAAERERLVSERRSRAAEASRLADEIARLKRRESRPRADPELERRLQSFDRVASMLDGLDRRIKAQDRAVSHARARFEARADSELATLAREPSAGGTAAAVAGRIEAVEAARQRVRAIPGTERGIRPPLDIALAPEDGPPEVQSKRALLESEHGRIAAAVGNLDRETAVVETRLALKRQLAREIEAASREAGSAMPLVQREADELLLAVKDLERQRETLASDRNRLSRDLAMIETRIEALMRRARELAPKAGTGDPE